MEEFLYSVTFDLMNLVGVVLSVLPFLMLRYRDVAATVTVGGICEKDTQEIIPQVKSSLTGLVFLIFTFIAKSVLSFIRELAHIDYSAILALMTSVIVVVALTVLFRVLVINRYWRKYDWKKAMGKSERE